MLKMFQNFLLENLLTLLFLEKVMAIVSISCPCYKDG